MSSALELWVAIIRIKCVPRGLTKRITCQSMAEDEHAKCIAFLRTAPPPPNLADIVDEVATFISRQRSKSRNVVLVTVSLTC